MAAVCTVLHNEQLLLLKCSFIVYLKHDLTPTETDLADENTSECELLLTIAKMAISDGD